MPKFYSTSLGQIADSRVPNGENDSDERNISWGFRLIPDLVPHKMGESILSVGTVIFYNFSAFNSVLSPQTKTITCLSIYLPYRPLSLICRSHIFVFFLISFIVKILNLYIFLLYTHLYHFFPVSIHYLQNAFVACYITCDGIFNRH